MQRIDYRLPLGHDLVDVVVEVEYPVERLLGRGDVVTPRAEHDDRRFDVAQIDALAARRANLAARQLVADEQVVRDPLHFNRIQQDRVAPPGLELEESLRFSVDLRIDVVGLSPIGVGRVEGLKICDQMRAVEDSGAEIARELRQPCSAEQSTEVAHGVLAPNAGPVGERRSGQDDRPSQVRPDRRHHHRLPAGLAVGDDDWLAFGLRMALGDVLDERSLCAADVFDRLSGFWLRQKADEVHGMAGAKRDADLAFRLHAANPGTVSRARVDNDDRRLQGIDRDIVGGTMRTSA